MKQILSPPEEIKYVMASVSEKHHGCFVWTEVRLELRHIKDANKSNVLVIYLEEFVAISRKYCDVSGSGTK